MADDIHKNVPIAKCGWLPYTAIEPGSAKKSDKLRKDESDLNKDLECIGLKTETHEGQIRLPESLALCRTEIIIND